jgi:sulfopyruvate decarboxylase TPP-binding subunit
MGIRVMRADTPRDLIETVESATALAFEAEQQVAVLLSQRLLGRKTW